MTTDRASVAPLLGPESRDKEARMRAMVDSAVELFADEGYASVSTRRIAEAAGCSETLLFRYFGGKRGLLLAICQDLGFASTPRTKAEDSHDVASYIEAYMLRMFGQMRAQSARLKVITSAIIGDSELSVEFEGMHDAEVTAIAADLRQFQERGHIASDVDLIATAATIEQAAYSIGLFMQIVYGKPEKELAAMARAFARALANGMRAAEELPVEDAWRQEAIRAATDASQELTRIMGLLNAGEAAPPKRSAARRAKPKV